MSLHWTIVANFLYFEIALGLLLTLPYISNKRWSNIFKSNFLKAIVSWGSYFFNMMVAILLILFIDAIREVIKYTQPEFAVVNLMNNLNTKDHVMMNMFRAQRNLYISGFALFLLLILRRMIGLICGSASLEAQNEAAMRQAESASRAAESLMDNAGGSGDGTNEKTKELEVEIAELKEKLSEARKSEKEANIDVKAMKSQSESIKREYDRLMKEMEELQKEKSAVECNVDEDSKKDQ